MPELHSNLPPPPDAGDIGIGIPVERFPANHFAPRVPANLSAAPSERPTHQFDAMFVLPVKPAAASELRDLLQQISDETRAQMRDPQAGTASILPFSELEGLHYARLILLDDEHGVGTRLVLATDYDGPEGQDCNKSQAFLGHLTQIAASERVAAGFDRLFQHCDGYQGQSDLAAFLSRHNVRSRTSYVGAPGRSVKQIHWELELRKQIEALLPQLTKQPLSAAALREAVRSQLKLRVPQFPAQPDFAKLLRRDQVLLALAGVGALVGLGPLALVGGLGAYAYFRHKEDTDPQFQITHDAKTLAELERASDEENHFLQNPLTHLVEIKPGLMRQALIRIVFAAIQYRARYVYNLGKLGEIPSIHFARWALIPPRHVLFLSNFDSSWQSYLGDFIDKASAGLTAVWSNTRGYPRTKNLLRAGSRDAARFLAWTRAHQRPTAVWYSAYPGLSIVNVNDNTAIRRGLADPASTDAESWLYRLRAVDRETVDCQRSDDHAREPTLSLDRVQGIILRGYGQMPEARYVMLRVTDGPAALKWLGTLGITNAEDGARSRALPGPLLNIAFTHSGFARLGVDPSVTQSFDPAFVQGSHHPQRARINGDEPASWDWGNEQNRVDVLLLVYAADTAAANAEVQKQLDSAKRLGLEHVATLEGTTLPGRKEHFGFRDGIGQPQVRGAGGSGLEDDAVPAGEFLLGHRDAYGNISHAPVSPRGFSMGHNGSYLVFRQLEQRVADFWKYCASQTDPSAVRVASKLVGRWPSGASLVRHPDADPNELRFQDEDDFAYLENDEDNDRYGARCPFGSHIRRTNPRDWNSAPSREEALSVSNQHRIVRRGRPYGPPLASEMAPEKLLAAAMGGDDGVPRGLQFLCFNSNIDRQFEFIQQHWCNNPHFAGLDNSPDPLVGFAPTAGSGTGFTPQADMKVAAPSSYSALPKFVRVLGGSYFFMPSITAIELLAQGQLSAQPCTARESVPPDEALHIDRMLEAMRRKMLSDFPKGVMRRGTHAKMHGCLSARFRVEPDVAEKLAHVLPPGAAERLGLFGAPRDYNAWVRFSNEQKDRPDARADLRAVAIKLLDVPGVKLLDGAEDSTEHDFIMISLDAFVAKNAAEFADMVEAIVDKRWRLLPFLLTHPSTLKQLIRVQKSGRATLLERSFFSAVPYLLGDVAVKYSLRPTHKPAASTATSDDPNSLRTDLKQQLARAAFSFDFLVQVQGDPKRMPIEDATVVWDSEHAPFVKVATLELLQQNFDTPERNAFGENLSFNPWCCLPAHRPLGGLNRARREIYRALARFRHDRNAV